MKKCVELHDCKCTIGMSAGGDGTGTLCCKLQNRCAFGAIHLQTAHTILLRDSQMEAIALFIQTNTKETRYQGCACLSMYCLGKYL